MAQTSEEKKALLDTLDKVKRTFKINMGGMLCSLEKDIEDGKITDKNTIQRIKECRERYNAMFENNEENNK